MNEIRMALVESTRLWRSGDTDQALKVLDGSIADATRENAGNWARRLSLHASLICRLNGDLQRARRYSELALAHGPDDPAALYSLARVLAEEEEIDLAEQYASMCYELSARGGTELDRARMELIVKRWPQLGTHRH